jgi:hypothetical protein
LPSKGGQWLEFLKREGRRTFPEKRNGIFLCKNLIKKEVRRLLYRQDARRREKEEELFLRKEMAFSYAKTL